MNDDVTRVGRGPPGRSSSGEWSRWAPGTVIGGHAIVRKLGQGGMGAVFVARHEGTGEERALKVLIFDAEREAIERFRREGDAQQRVGAHPNIVRVLASGEDVSTGAAYLVTDLATGGDLKERLKLGPLEPREAARLGAALARGLAHVHAAGVLHRDLKPGNVVFDARGTPKLMDFGLARMQGARRLTVTGAAMGTPAYMSPEQAEGERVDERADVYGLGAVLYECLTGCAPYEADSDIGLIKRVLTEEVERPGARRPGIPPALEAIVVRAMARDVSVRHPTAAELALDLEAFLAGRSTSAAPRRAGVPRVAAALGLVILALAGAVVLLAARRLDAGSVSPSTADAPARLVTAAEPRLLDPPLHDAALVPDPALRSWLLLPAGSTLRVRVATDRKARLQVTRCAPGAEVTDPVQRRLALDRALEPGESALDVDLATGWQEVALLVDRRAADARSIVVLPAGLLPVPGRPNAVRAEVDGSVLLLVPPGDAFRFRGDGARPRDVTLRAPFLLGETEVSWAQLDAFRRGSGGAIAGHTPLVLPEGGAPFEPGDEWPASAMLVTECEDYGEWMGARLPTGVEWEYAALGVRMGNTMGAADGWPYSCPVSTTLPGGTGRWGHLHLQGNMCEIAQQDPAAPNHVVNYGAGFDNDRSPDAAYDLDEYPAGIRNDGFRLARDIGSRPGRQRSYPRGE